jgi:hypothetical protein
MLLTQSSSISLTPSVYSTPSSQQQQQHPVEVHVHGNQKSFFQPTEQRHSYYPKLPGLNTIVSHHFLIEQPSSSHINNINNNNKNGRVQLPPSPLHRRPIITSVPPAPLMRSTSPCLFRSILSTQPTNSSNRNQTSLFTVNNNSIKETQSYHPNMKTIISPSLSSSDSRHHFSPIRPFNEHCDNKEDGSCTENDSTCDESDGNNKEKNQQLPKRNPHARRTVTTIEERNYLERIYRETPYPTRQQYEQIRRHLGWKSTRRVTKWFNNRRYNAKSHRIKPRD